MGASSENPARDGAANPETALTPSAPALLIRGEGLEDSQAEPERDTRLDRMPMQLNVAVKVRSFRVQDLLTLQKGTVVETVHEHSQDVPLQCGGALLMWAEFELMGQKLAVRVTRLA
ncbi:MAG TPA: FliM/FliN family flagellar motor C-terminal domain-containing protein [Acidobacteriaceae bacterium]|nr:FliM/FliN family flagellar motor C-terminal domain-containing protein [Acidobacteriaceae bacterium]